VTFDPWIPTAIAFSALAAEYRHKWRHAIAPKPDMRYVLSAKCGNCDAPIPADAMLEAITDATLRVRRGESDVRVICYPCAQLRAAITEMSQ
jgi:hypothetical protein